MIITLKTPQCCIWDSWKWDIGGNQILCIAADLVPSNAHLQLPNSSEKSSVYLHYLHYASSDQLSWTWDIGGNQVLPRFRKQDLVPSNSQIQPPKFWLWIPMLPKLSHRTNLILQWPMPTDRGAGDKMLEKTELLKLSVADKGRVQFPTTLTFKASS